ncbi:MAG TPA: ribose 5-phosphate isomerase B [Firmicutes bacterium]|nr:ribose 5-phosphate isomerase B [Bacillota bacterium]
MRVAIGSDHAGFYMKEEIKGFLSKMGVEFSDFGCHSPESVDYPDIGRQVAKSVAEGEYDRGILICGTGIGMSMVANKVRGVRAALCQDEFSARASRQHNNANVLALGARVIGPGLACSIVEVFLRTDFEGGRHARRVGKIEAIEGEE